MKKIIKYVCKHRFELFKGTLCMLAIIGVDLCSPYLQKVFLDQGILNKKYNLIVPILICFLLISVFKALFGYVKEFSYDKVSSLVQEDIKIDLFNHIQSLEFKFFDGMNTGELMSRIGEDVENIWDTVSFGLRLFIENIIYFTLSAGILFTLDWKLTTICILVMLPISFIGIKLEKEFGKCYEEISDKTAEINTTAQENIAGVRLVKAFARERHEVNKFLKMNQEYYDLNVKQAKVLGTYFPPIDFLTNVSQIMMIVIGGIFVMNGSMTLGTLVAFSGYIGNLIWPMRQLGSLMDLLSRNSASAKKIFNIIERASKVESKEDSYKGEEVKGDISFKNVFFKYDDKMILKNINLDIKSGSTVAIMGPTGSGKTSLLNLIGRYYDVTSGQVLVDDIDVRDYNLEFLRSNMSVVPQDTFLFSDSIKNNIKFSNANASDEEVKRATSISCCNEFIEDLENGYDTEIGERGLGLSGGQKQRISIARALLRKAPILILDDSTSALDMETEHQLLGNLNCMNKNCTTFIIAHRISAVKNADIILYLEDGEIKEKGTHDELIKRKGKYYDIYCEQFKDFDMVEKEVI